MGIAFAIAALIVGLILVGGITWLISSSSHSSVLESAKIVGPLGTPLVLVVAAAIAAWKQKVFREFEPRLNVIHHVTHRDIGASYVHIGVVVTLHNSSNRRILLGTGRAKVQKISPVTDDKVLSLYSDSKSGDGNTYYPPAWPTLDDFEIRYGRFPTAVEPGERHQTAIEFIVGNGVKSLCIYTFFYNANENWGWGATSFYDIDHICKCENCRCTGATMDGEAALEAP